MPESPRYLSVRGNLKCAREILMKFKMTNDHDIQKDLQLWTSLRHPVGYLSAFKSYEFNIFHVIPVFGLHIFEQLIGVIPILFYLQKIFRLSGKYISISAQANIGRRIFFVWPIEIYHLLDRAWPSHYELFFESEWESNYRVQNLILMLNSSGLFDSRRNSSRWLGTKMCWLKIFQCLLLHNYYNFIFIYIYFFFSFH